MASKQPQWLPELNKKQLARFWASVSKPVAGDGCWLWVGTKNNGRAMFNGGRKLYASRIMYKLYFEDPFPFLVCHTCDNGLCVNPDHLFLGDDADNVADKRTKDRDYAGKVYCGSSMAETDIIAIRESTETHEIIAARFGISGASVCLIKQGRVHQGVGGPVGILSPAGIQLHRLRNNEIAVRAIRCSRERSSVLVARYGVSKKAIWNIRRGTSYTQYPWTDEERAALAARSSS